MSAHTPGPWLVETRFRLVVNTVHPHVVVCAIPGERSEVGLANARLIAAAPELLEALKGAEWKLIQQAGYADAYLCPTCHNNQQDGHTADCAIGNALAKAEGRQ